MPDAATLGARHREAASRKHPLHHDPAAVRDALHQAGLSQAELARRLGRSRSSISEILAGTRSAGAPLLKDIATALGCHATSLQAHHEPWTRCCADGATTEGAA